MDVTGYGTNEIPGTSISKEIIKYDDYINSMKDLIMMNLYYNRPAEELIFLTRAEHKKLHKLKA